MYLLARIIALPYLWKGIRKEQLKKDPVDQFSSWYRTAKLVWLPMPNAVTLSTANLKGRPSARMVLFKKIDQEGIVFYTNYDSVKADELENNPFAALTFFWAGLARQVRIEGNVKRTSNEESRMYFSNRPRNSQLGAWASKQSKEIENREMLENKFLEYKEKYQGAEIPCPPFWGGYRLIPSKFEFWQGRAFRLHDRFQYTKEKDRWRISRLAP